LLMSVLFCGKNKLTKKTGLNQITPFLLNFSRTTMYFYIISPIALCFVNSQRFLILSFHLMWIFLFQSKVCRQCLVFNSLCEHIKCQSSSYSPMKCNLQFYCQALRLENIAKSTCLSNVVCFQLKNSKLLSVLASSRPCKLSKWCRRTFFVSLSSR